MATYLPLAPVSEALLALFNADATLLALAPGGVQTAIPQDPTYPLLWIEVIESRQLGGFGTKPGVGALPEITIRLHAFSLLQGWKECRAILQQAIADLSTSNALAVTGYKVCGTEPFHDDTIPLPDQELNGVVVQELVSNHRLYIEEQ